MVQDIKTKRIIASLLHSRAIVSGAPNYVLTAMRSWVEELDRAEGQDAANVALNKFTDNISVSDSASLQLKNEDKIN